MPDSKKRYESMLFNYESCNRTDFRDGEIKPIITTSYKGKEGKDKRAKYIPLKDIHALTDWRVPNVPFDLFGKAKDVVRTNPHEVQKPYGKVEDLERKAIQMTRPRLIISPALSLDDMEDGARKLIVGNMYTTSTSQAMEEALAQAHYFNVRAPLPDRSAPANPLTLAKVAPAYVSPEWRMDSVSWDNRQLRAFCDPTKDFWLDRAPPNCSVCKNTAALEEMKKMKRKH